MSRPVCALSTVLLLFALAACDDGADDAASSPRGDGAGGSASQSRDAVDENGDSGDAGDGDGDVGGADDLVAYCPSEEDVSAVVPAPVSLQPAERLPGFGEELICLYNSEEHEGKVFLAVRKEASENEYEDSRDDEDSRIAPYPEFGSTAFVSENKYDCMIMWRAGAGTIGWYTADSFATGPSYCQILDALAPLVHESLDSAALPPA